MKDIQTINDVIELKKIWPAILEHGSLQIQEAVEPHRKFLERVFDGCWLKTKYLPESTGACPVTAKYSLENGKTMKVLSSNPDRKLEIDFWCYVFFAELVLRERYQKNGCSSPGEYVRGPKLESLLGRMS